MRRAVLAVMAAGAAAILGGAAPGAPAVPALHVDGKWMKDSAGASVALHGVAIADLDAIAHGDRNQAVPTTLQDIIDKACADDWHVDVIRLTVHPQVTDETGSHGWLHYTPEDYFRKILDPAVQEVIRKGRYAIVDWHYVGANWHLPDVVSATEAFWLGSGTWEGIARRYANTPNVLFELFNEPGPGSWQDWQQTAQTWVDGIRARGAHNVVIVGGPVWSQVLPRRAADLLTGENIAYACHIYPAHVRGRIPPWMDYVSTVAPVVMTEWGFEKDGPMPVDGTASGYGKLLKAYLDQRPNVGWVAWCFDSVYRPVMFDTRWVLLGNGQSTQATRFSGGPDDTADNYMGQFAKTWLAEAAARRAGH